MTDPVLQLRNVVAGYGETHVLQGISFDLNRGERLAIIGRNGVGKTTTLSTIMGLTRLHRGTIHFKGRQIDRLPPYRRARAGLGLVPQTRDIFPSLSVEENLIAAVRNGASIDEAYELFPRLKERRRNGGAQLSGGEQQMLSIARTLMGRPDVLLLDEPLEGLAPVIRDMLVGVFERLASKRGQTIILVEQHTALAIDFAERVLVLDQGAIVLEQPAKELKKRPDLLDRHVGLALDNQGRHEMPTTFPDGMIPPVGIPISDVDPFSIEFFEDPHCIHGELRELGPVVFLTRYGVFALARYQEVHDTLNNWQVFCSSRGVGISDFAKETPWRPASLVLETDPPAHDKYRAVLSRVLSPAVMKGLRDRFAAAAERKVDALLARGRFDGIGDLAEAFPLSVFPDAVGLVKEGRDHLLPYANLAFNAFGPANELRQQAMERAAPHVAWVNEQCKRENLAPGGLGAHVHAASDTGEITSAEAALLVRSLLSAGLDTTVNGIGATIYCLARFPGEWQKLRANPVLARAAFEEAVRFESPVQTFFSTTTRPVRIGDAEVGEGQKVLMFLGAANRDPRRWENPDVYDIERKVSGHVGFGSGVHMCVGQLLARLEVEVLLSAMARKVGSIEITGEPKRAYNNTLRGLASLPLEIESAN